MDKLFANIYSVKQITNNFYNIFLVFKKSRVFNQSREHIENFTRANNFDEDLIQDLRYYIYWGSFRFDTDIDLTALSDMIKYELNNYNIPNIQLRCINYNKIFENKEVLSAHLKNLYLDIQNTITKILLVNFGLNYFFMNNNDIEYAIFFGEIKNLIKFVDKNRIPHSLENYLDSLQKIKIIIIEKRYLDTIIEGYPENDKILLVDNSNRLTLAIENYLLGKGDYTTNKILYKPTNEIALIELSTSLSDRGIIFLDITYYDIDFMTLITNNIFNYNEIPPLNKINNFKFRYKLNTNAVKNLIRALNLGYNRNIRFENNLDDPSLRMNIAITNSQLYQNDFINKYQFERFGFNQMGTQVFYSHINLYWYELLQLGYNFNLSINRWVNSLTSIGTISYLTSKLKFVEDSSSNKRYLKLLDNDDLFISSNFIQNDNYSNCRVVKKTLNKSVTGHSLYIFIDTKKPKKNISPIYDELSSIYIANTVERDNKHILEFHQFTNFSKENIILIKNILTNNHLIGFDIKNILTILLYNGILENSDIFKLSVDDVLLQAWVYNPRINKIKSNNIEYYYLKNEFTEEDDLVEASKNIGKRCNDYNSYDLDQIHNNFISQIIDIENGEEYHNQIEIFQKLVKINNINNLFNHRGLLHKLNLKNAYLLEIDATKSFAKIEYRGLVVDKPHLDLIVNALERAICCLQEQLDEGVKTIFTDEELISKYILK